MKTPEIRYFVYTRKSTDENKRQQLSLEAQEREMRAFAKREQLTVVALLEESRSAKEPGRPIFNRMLDRIERGEATGIICWDIDRLYRNPVDDGRVRWMLQRGVIACIRTPTRSYYPADAGLLIAIEGGRATDFIIRHKRNVERGVREKLLKGGWPGRAPLGYVYDKDRRNIVPHRTEAPIVRQVFEEVSTGIYGVECITYRFAELGIRSKTGRRLSKFLVHRILKNPLYKGVMIWSGVSYAGNYEPLVSSELFEKVAKAIQVRSKPRNTRKGHDFPLRGLFHCSCGSMMSAQWARGHGGLYRYYRCTRKAGACREPYIQERDLAAQSAEVLRPLAISKAEADEIRALIDAEGAKASAAVEAEREKVTDRLATVQTQINKLTSAFARGVLDDESYESATAELVAEKTALKHEKKRLQRTGSSFWIEPAKEVVTALELAGKIVVEKSPHEISNLVRKTGTNRLISRKKVTFEFAQPYDFTSALLAETRAGFDTRPVHNLGPVSRDPNWCSGQESNLHAFRHMPLKHACLPIPPPERLEAKGGYQKECAAVM